MKFSEIIIQEGKKITPNFSLDANNLRKNYQTVYEGFKNSFICPLGCPKKGFLHVGGVGVGKTILMRIFQRIMRNTERRFKWLSAYELKDLLEIEGVAWVKKHYGRDLKQDLYIDDIGVTSSDYMKYGNTTNILAELLLERYDLFISEGYLTHLSTNLPPRHNDAKVPTLEKILTARVMDRVREMCQIITFEGGSLRK